jgi:serine/threonine protein kinase
MRSGDTVARRFQVERFAGAGAMGLVYRARDVQTGEWVALKVLAHGSAERFLREARALAEVSHPHIVRYVDHGHTEAGEPYLAMEWLEGADLAQKLQAGPLPLAQALGLARSVAGALAVAHGHGVVHRDVKPSNLFLVSGDPARVKVLDFGAARFIRTTSAPTASGIVLGTPGYLAPEQVNEDRAVDGRADVFALGCVLYECVAGRPAFVAQHVLALLGKILRENPPPLRQFAAHAPEVLEDLLIAMLAKDPDGRPASMTAITEALDRLIPAGASLAAQDIAGPVVYRWWSGDASDHFYTTEPDGERALPCGYIYEGARFQTLREGCAGTVPLFRWYSRTRSEHFYTTDPEGELAPATGYQLEGILGYVAQSEQPGTVALHRWWNASYCDHFYTTDREGELAPRLGYEYQGVIGHVLSADEKALQGGVESGVRSAPGDASGSASPSGPEAAGPSDDGVADAAETGRG